jgi:hypothetical protein
MFFAGALQAPGVNRNEKGEHDRLNRDAILPPT